MEEQSAVLDPDPLLGREQARQIRIVEHGQARVVYVQLLPLDHPQPLEEAQRGDGERVGDLHVLGYLLDPAERLAQLVHYVRIPVSYLELERPLHHRYAAETLRVGYVTDQSAVPHLPATVHAGAARGHLQHGQREIVVVVITNSVDRRNRYPSSFSAERKKYPI